MAKRAKPDDEINVVRSTLAAEVAGPASKKTSNDPPEAGGDAVPSPSSEPEQTTNGKATTRNEALIVNRKFLVSKDEARQIDEMTSILSTAFGAKLGHSQITRALWSLVAGSEEAIKVTGQRQGAIHREPPLRGDYEAMAEFEEDLAGFLAASIKRSGKR